MKISKYILLLTAILIGFTSCELKDNIDPKRATDVPASTLFTNALVEMVDQVDDTDVNYNISRLLVQYWQESIYFSESRYDFQDRGIPDSYQISFYRDVLADFLEAKTLLRAQELTGISATERDNKIAVIEINETYVWQVLVDAFGNIPYSEALQNSEDSTPAYDDAATVYTDLIKNLKAALDKLDASAGSFGSADLIYDGDVSDWKAFGAALLLRIGMRLADYAPSDAQDAISAAMNYGAISSADQNGTFAWNGVVPFVNTIYEHFVVDNRKDYLPSNTLVDMMLNLNDPRISMWLTQVDTSTEFGVEKLAYVGAVVGLDGAQSFNNFSNFTSMFMDATLPSVLIDYAEVQFLLAEAVERGMMSGDAESYYNEGITASIVYWGGTPAMASDYLANPDVAYSTATGDWKQKIGTQKWLALYNRGVEAWAEWRRLDYPVLNVPEGLSYGDIPVRMPYPFDEGEFNGANYDAASAAIGGDDHRTKLFWDMH